MLRSRFPLGSGEPCTQVRRPHHQHHQQTKKQTLDTQAAWLIEVVKAAQERDWYGTLTIVFEEGVMKRVRQDTSLIPP